LLASFFTSYATHRDLHSFPTRRSSDLLAGAGQRQRRAELADVVAGDHLEDARTAQRRRGVDPTDARMRVRAPDERDVVHARQRRSEEHTSELQSPYDLVCRLLLEKKKK